MKVPGRDYITTAIWSEVPPIHQAGEAIPRRRKAFLLSRRPDLAARCLTETGERLPDKEGNVNEMNGDLSVYGSRVDALLRSASSGRGPGGEPCANLRPPNEAEV